VIVAEVNIPFRLSAQQWITVPPQTYGGVQSALAALIDGISALGHEVKLLGAPGSSPSHPDVEVIDAGTFVDIARWLRSARFDIVHDHSCSVELSSRIASPMTLFHKWWHIYHKSSPPEPAYAAHPNIITLSSAHRSATGLASSRVVRLPVNPHRFEFSADKSDYLLFLGRISPWKGVAEAARFARCAGLKLIVAGPRWEREYFDYLMHLFHDCVEYVGEVGGEQKRRLLAKAIATMVFSQRRLDQTGHPFVEPGSTVVSESAVSGTPVISSDNGCLSEIVPHVGHVIDANVRITRQVARRILESLPAPAAVRDRAIEQWGHIKIANEYLTLCRAMNASHEGELNRARDNEG
jgi:glycosyltransferase involved in cell wall biosynthesis